MNDRREPSTPNDDFEDQLRWGLGRLAESTPASAPDGFDPETVPMTVTAGDSTRRKMPILAAAAAVATLVAGLAVVNGVGDDEGQQAGQVPGAADAPALSSSDAELDALPVPTADSVVDSAVGGELLCGSELPVAVDVPSADGEPIPGAAVAGPVADGQFAQHWQLPGGVVEVRWPADERELYDTDEPSLRGESAVFDTMTVMAPEGGDSLTVAVPNLDASAITLSSVATTGIEAPCDVVQMRFIDAQGNQTTRGYNVVDLTAEPIFGIDLDPLVTSLGTGDAPDPSTVVSCGTGIDTAISGPTASEPAAALLSFLESDDAPDGLMTSGYTEFAIADDEVAFAYINDAGLITHLTVTAAGDDWAVSRLASAGC